MSNQSTNVAYFWLLTNVILASKKKTIYEWLSTRVSLTIRNEENYALKRNYRFSYSQALIGGTVFAISMGALTLWLATKVIGMWYNPRQDYFNTKRKVILLALAVDSLEQQIKQKDIFISDIKSIVKTGEVKDSTIVKPPKDINQQEATHSKAVDLDFLPPVDSVIRNEFEKNQPSNNVTFSSEPDIYKPILLNPVNGIVTENYDSRKKHYGVDIVAKKDEPVKATSEGVVIISSWSDETGYVIGIQHNNNLVSLYKHNSVLLKSVGSYVSSGEVIALIGNTGELTTGPHLHFELWYKGRPLNPRELIYF